MEIIVGRDQQTRKLNVIKDGSSKLYGQAGSVPMDVSRHHISLQPTESGKWIIKNLNERNVTFVNGIAVESKAISESDKVELGNSRYLFPWDALSEPKVETADIRPLRQIWEEYNLANIRIRKQQKNIGLLASIPMGFTMLGGLIAGVGPEEIRGVAYLFTAIALLIMLYGFYRRFNDNSIEKQEELKKKLQRNYTCPKCGHFLGFQDYEVLTQSDACPYCKTMYKK
jgi:hypothetical protein